MKTHFTFVILLTLFYTGQPVFSQSNVISGKSQAVKFNLTPKFERGLPPNLFVNMVFEDDNNNGILEADEKARLNLVISNKGKGPAQGLKIKVINDTYDAALKISDGIEVPYLYPDQTTSVTVPIEAGREIKSSDHKLEISITEHFGYDMDPVFLVVNTYKFQEPQLVFSGLEIVDIGEGTAAILEDGQIQAGEMVKVKLVVQNIGQNIAKNSRFEINTTDRNIYMENNAGSLGDLGIGEVKELWFTMSPNKRVTTTDNLPVTLTVTNDFNRGNIQSLKLPISLDQKPPAPQIISVKADVESLTRQVARFEHSSNRITANIANVIDISQAPPSKTRRTDAVAILIGIEQYNSFAPAPYATNDVRVFETYCRNVLGIDKIFTYTNEQVSGFFFENTFNPMFGELQKAVAKGQTEVFVFYAGHGLPSKDGDKVYLFPSDGRVEALEMQGYDLNRLYDNLNKMQARSVTVFIDACFSGISRTTETFSPQNLVSMRGVRIKPKIEQPWEGNPSFSVFTSSNFDETSLGFDPSQTGLFTYYLCAGLQGKADANGDKKITASELAAYISDNVQSTSQKIAGLQSPQFFGNGDLVLTEF